jgi:abortive infection bacteriophage resistance protein
VRLPFTKPALSIEDQLNKLIELGMVIADRSHAEHCLQHISYYRLSAYWLPFENPKGEVGPRFKPDTTFENVMALYDFDRKLRLLVLDAIERIEVAVRGSWAYQMAMLGGSHEYLKADHYTDITKFIKNGGNLDHEVGRSKDTFIKHYKRKYDSPEFPPVWMVSELMSFGLLSRWYAALKEPRVRQLIADPFDIDERIFVTVVHQLAIVRNMCAHHSRLWNRALDVEFTLPRSNPADLTVALNRYEPKRIYNTFAMLQFLLSKADPANDWGKRLITLMATLLEGRSIEMGFPPEWLSFNIWCDTN